MSEASRHENGGILLFIRYTDYMNDSQLEAYYETAILPQYKDVVQFERITWKDHGKIDLDAWGHYFDDENGREYVLVYEDFPGNVSLDDGLSHDVVKIGDATSIQVQALPGRQIDNIFGYFTLYREIR